MLAFTYTTSIVLRHCKYGAQILTAHDFHSTDKVIAIRALNKYTFHTIRVQMTMDVELPRIADRRRGHRLRLRLSGTHCTGYVVCPEKKITTIDGKRQYRKESCLFTLQSSVVGYHIECLLMSLQILLPHPDFCLSSGNVIKKNIKKRTK